MFPVVLDQVCTHCSRDFGPLLHTGSPDLSGFGAVAGQHGVSASSIDYLLGSGHWTGYARTLKCFLQCHSLVALALCLGSLSCWKTKPWPIFNALTEGRRLLAKISLYMAHPSSPQYSAVILSPLQKCTPKAWFSTPMLHAWDGVLGIVLIPLLPPNTASGVYTKSYIWSHLTT